MTIKMIEDWDHNTQGWKDLGIKFRLNGDGEVEVFIDNIWRLHSELIEETNTKLEYRLSDLDMEYQQNRESLFLDRARQLQRITPTEIEFETMKNET